MDSLPVSRWTQNLYFLGVCRLCAGTPGEHKDYLCPGVLLDTLRYVAVVDQDEGPYEADTTLHITAGSIGGLAERLVEGHIRPRNKETVTDVFLVVQDPSGTVATVTAEVTRRAEEIRAAKRRKRLAAKGGAT